MDKVMSQQHGRPNAALRWALTAFVAHTVFLALVLVVDQTRASFTLRNLHEYIVDRHAFEAWWWAQNHFTRPLGNLLFPLAKAFGLETASVLFWLAWYSIVGAFPYVVASSFVAGFRMRRTAPSEVSPSN